MDHKSKLNKKIGIIIEIVFCFIIPIAMMLIIGIIPKFDVDSTMDSLISGILIPLLLFYLVYILTIILHELGHLIMGLCNNAIFEEFSFLFFSLYKENEKIQFRFKGLINGLGGYCSMNFPSNIKLKEYKKFGLGGIIVNFILSLIGIILCLCSSNNILLLISLYITFINIGFGISNLLPFETTTGMDTDGMKIYRMNNEKNYISNLNKNMKLSKLLKSGTKIEDIPEDLIYKPESINNKPDMEMTVLYISKLIYLKKYIEAEELIKRCLNEEQNKLTTVSRYNLKGSLIDIYIENDKFEQIKEIYDDELYKYIKSVSNFEKSIMVYVFLYYIIINNFDKANNIKIKIDDYFSKVNNNSTIINENKKTYELIIKKYYN